MRSDQGEWTRLLSFIKINRSSYVFGLILDCACSAFLALVMAFTLKSMIQAVSENHMPDLFGAMSMLVLITSLVAIVSPWLSYMHQSSVKRNMAKIRNEGFHKVLYTSLEESGNRSKGEIISTLNNDLGVLEQAFTEQLKGMLYTLILGVGSVVSMLVLDWRLSLVLIVLSVLSYVINKLMTRTIRVSSDNAQEQLSLLTQTYSELISGSIVMRLFPGAVRLHPRFQKENKIYMELSIQISKKRGLLEGYNYLLNFLSFGGVIAIGALLVLQGQVGIAVIVAMVQLQTNVNSSFNQFSRILGDIQLSMTGAARVNRLLEIPEEEFSSEEDICVGLLDIKARGVCFSYDHKKAALKGLSFSIPHGKKVAFVGTSGSGKSTIAKLMIGLYRNYEGSLLIAGREIKNWPLNELRKTVAFIPQDPFLFEGSIADNIRGGNQNASEEAVIQAAKQAGIYDFIVSLPDGMYTRVGENGGALSGGQKQRIAIARVFLEDAPIIILDEPTSALDNQTEQFLQEQLNKWRGERTLIIIAHRLHTIQDADQIIVMQNGSIREQGSQAELMNAQGVYQQLYKMVECS